MCKSLAISLLLPLCGCVSYLPPKKNPGENGLRTGWRVNAGSVLCFSGSTLIYILPTRTFRLPKSSALWMKISGARRNSYPTPTHTHTEILDYTNTPCTFFLLLLRNERVGMANVQFILEICSSYVGEQVLKFFLLLFSFRLPFVVLYDDDNSVKIISMVHFGGCELGWCLHPTCPIQPARFVWETT